MPFKSTGSTRGQLLLVLIALTLPTGMTLWYHHPTHGKKLRIAVAELGSEQNIEGQPSAWSALKSMDFGVVGSQLKRQFEKFREADEAEVAEVNETNTPQADVNLANTQSSVTDRLSQSENAEIQRLRAASDRETEAFDNEIEALAASNESETTGTRITLARPALPNTGGYPPILKTITLDEEHFGLPIARYQKESWIMGNDGAIKLIPRQGIVKEEILSEPFIPIEPASLVINLRKEFGPDFHVQAEVPFVFVSRKGASLYWNERFRLLHSAVKQFCRTRGITTRDLEFPLIAIIFRNQAEFYQYGRANNIDIPPNCLGIYSSMSNRIYLFEDPKLLSKQETIETICHEATHQLAWNLGLHQRCADTPLWLSEGLATVFEAPAYAQPNSTGKSPWPAVRRETWAQLLEEPQFVNLALDSLIRNDNLFQKSPDAAYSIAWGLTHYLANTHPKQFNTYLEQIRKLPPFVPFDSNSRWEHFRAHFGDDVSKLSIALRKHIISLR